jgi:hypothetical protein
MRTFSPEVQKLFPLVVGPTAGVLGWLLFRTSSGQPTTASFWFAVLVAFGLGLILGFGTSRRIGGALLFGVVTSVLALVTWLIWLAAFASSVLH